MPILCNCIFRRSTCICGNPPLPGVTDRPPDQYHPPPTEMTVPPWQMAILKKVFRDIGP